VSSLSKSQLTASWIAQIAAAGILLQTLFFKFTGAPESVYIFERLGAEPWGRLASGVAELAAGIALLVPATAAAGAAAALAIVAGALASHLTVLGIEVQGDGGLLFALACVVFLSSLVVVVLRRRELPWIGSYFS